MKKLLTLFLAVMLLFTMTACDSEESATTNEESATTNSELTEAGIRDIISPALFHEISTLNPVTSDCNEANTTCTILNTKNKGNDSYEIYCKLGLYSYRDEFLGDQYYTVYIENGTVTDCVRDPIKSNVFPWD